MVKFKIILSISGFILIRELISKGRANLESISKNSDDFVTTFTAQLHKLIPHNFIAKKQSEYLVMKKARLQQYECIVICDFAENYHCVIQVCGILFRLIIVQLRRLLIQMYVILRMQFKRNIGTISKLHCIPLPFIIRTTSARRKSKVSL